MPTVLFAIYKSKNNEKDSINGGIPADGVWRHQIKSPEFPFSGGIELRQCINRQSGPNGSTRADVRVISQVRDGQLFPVFRQRDILSQTQPAL